MRVFSCFSCGFSLHLQTTTCLRGGIGETPPPLFKRHRHPSLVLLLQLPVVVTIRCLNQGSDARIAAVVTVCIVAVEGHSLSLGCTAITVVLAPSPLLVVVAIHVHCCTICLWFEEAVYHCCWCATGGERCCCGKVEVKVASPGCKCYKFASTVCLACSMLDLVRKRERKKNGATTLMGLPKIVAGCTTHMKAHAWVR